MNTSKWLQVNSDVEYKECHVLPCAIKHDGVVDGSKFEVSTCDGHLRSQFRGRPLHGFKVDLKQHGYSGYILVPKEDDSSGEQLIQKGAFDSLVTWAHGKEPPASDAWGKSLEELVKFSRVVSED